jgi:hypothetical protein
MNSVELEPGSLVMYSTRPVQPYNRAYLNRRLSGPGQTAKLNSLLLIASSLHEWVGGWSIALSISLTLRFKDVWGAKTLRGRPDAVGCVFWDCWKWLLRYALLSPSNSFGGIVRLCGVEATAVTAAGGSDDGRDSVKDC